MSAFEQIQSSAEEAILELESEIVDLEEKIESYKLRIQNARVQIQALKKFLVPEDNVQGHSQLTNGALADIILEILTDLHPQSVHYKDLADLIAEKGFEISGKQPEKSVLNSLMKLARAGKVQNSGKGYYVGVNGREEVA